MAGFNKSSDWPYSPRAPVVLYLVTEDWYFLSHRLPMALAAKQCGL